MVQVAAARNDPHGVFLGGACHFFPIAGDSVHAELLACRREVQLALEVGVQKIILETDNQGVAQSLAQQEIDRSRFAPLVKEMRDLLATWWSVVCAGLEERPIGLLIT